MDDYRDSINGSGVLGVVAAGTSITGTIEEYGDADVFRTVFIAGLTYTVDVAGIGSNPLGFAFVQIDDNNGNYQGFGQVPDDFTDGSETSGFRYYTIYDPFGDDEGYDTLGSYRLTISAGFGSDAADSIVGTTWNDAVNGAGGNDWINGGAGADSLAGGAGNDTILGGNARDDLYGGSGLDVLRGQANDDTLTGGDGADVLIGGQGSDRFVFASTSQSSPTAADTLRAGDGGAAFEAGETISLSAIDANTTAAGNQAFTFGGVIGQGATGQKGFLYVSSVGQDTLVRGNTDNDAAWEFVLKIEDGAGRSAAWYHAYDFEL